MAQSKLEIVITAIDKASGVFGGLDDALGKLGKLAGGIVLGGLAAAAAGTAALGVGLIKLAQDAAVLLPIKESFDAINKAAGDSSDEMLKALRKSGKGMISNTDLMKNFNLAAQLVSVEFAQNLPEAMGYLQKVAGATGQDMGYMMDSLIRGVGRLSPLILDNLGVSIDLTSAYDAYAASIGKTTGELSKQEQQTAVMQEVMRQLAANTAAMPNIANPFQQLAVTFQNLKDQVALSLGPVVLPLIQQLADTIARFVESDTFQGWLVNVATWLNEHLVPAFWVVWDWLSVQLPAAIQTATTFWTTQFLPALQSVWDWLQNQLPIAIQNLKTIWETELQPVMVALGTFLRDTLIPAIGSLVTFFTENLIPAVRTVEEWLNKQTAAQDKLGASVRENVWPIFQEAWGWIKTNVIPVAQALWQKLLNLQNTFNNLKLKLIAFLVQLQIMKQRLLDIKLPSWLRPGSPTPFELGLAGIIGQIDILAGQSIPRLTRAFSAMDQPMPTTGLSSLATGGGPLSSLQTAGAAGLGGASGVTVVYSPVFSAASMHEFEQNLVPLIDRQLTLNQRRRVGTK